MQRMGAISLAMACMTCAGGPVFAAGPATFADDVAFLRDHGEVLVLSSADGKAQVAVSPAYQGRVMTSSARGAEGPSFGWINRDLIASGEILPHINPCGGEDRFWMGPEGGQFAIFFPKEVPFEFEHWQTPPVIDTEPFELAGKTPDSLRFVRRALFPNYSGTWFDVHIDRTIRLLGRSQTESLLGIACPASVDLVAYASENVLTNKGADPWKKETGLLSIWILGMYNPSPDTTVVVPFEQGPESERGSHRERRVFRESPGGTADRGGTGCCTSGATRSTAVRSGWRRSAPSRSWGVMPPRTVCSPLCSTRSPKARRTTSIRCGNSRRSRTPGMS